MVLALLAVEARAQETVTVQQPGPFNRSPTGIQLGSLLAGTDLRADSTAGAWRHVTLEGWIFTASTRTDRREGFDISVRASPTENLRIEPNGRIIARLSEGALLRRVRTQGGWTLVRREGWVPTRILPQPPTVDLADPGTYDVDTNRVEFRSQTGLASSPTGDTLATVAAGTTAEIVARSGEWARVRVEGWVHRDSLRPATDGALIGVSASEVRANPDQYLGREVDWELQFVAVQTADELRPEMPHGQQYLLTRGPVPETGFVYVVIPDSEVERFRATQPLENLTMRVRILAPRTRYLPNPVVQLLAVIESR